MLHPSGIAPDLLLSRLPADFALGLFQADILFGRPASLRSGVCFFVAIAFLVALGDLDRHQYQARGPLNYIFQCIERYSKLILTHTFAYSVRNFF